MTTTKNIPSQSIPPNFARENRVKLTADVQVNHGDSSLTVPQGETGTIIDHVNVA